MDGILCSALLAIIRRIDAIIIHQRKLGDNFLRAHGDGYSQTPKQQQNMCKKTAV